MSIIDLNLQTTDRLPLKPIKISEGEWMYDGLVPSKLYEVRTEEVVAEKGEFAGETLKILRFEFSNITKTDEPDRFLSHIENIIGTKKRSVKTDPDSELIDMEIVSKNAKETTITPLMIEQWKRIKHILDELRLSPNFIPVKDIKKEDVKKYLDVLKPELKAKERLKVYNAYFQYLCDFVNNGKNGKPMYHDAKGNPNTFWLYLTPNYGTRNHYEIPNFTGKGFIEPLIISKEGKFLPPKRLEVSNKKILELGTERRKPGQGADLPTNEIDADVKGALGLE